MIQYVGTVKDTLIGTRSRFFFTTMDEKSLVRLGMQVHHKVGCCY
jgi:hypothetical protein